jgi:hypothetical protein
MRAPAVPVLDDPFRAPADVGRAIPLATIQPCGVATDRIGRGTSARSPMRSRDARRSEDKRDRADRGSRIRGRSWEVKARMSACAGVRPLLRAPPLADGSHATSPEKVAADAVVPVVRDCLLDRLSETPLAEIGMEHAVVSPRICVGASDHA